MAHTSVSVRITGLEEDLSTIEAAVKQSVSVSMHFLADMMVGDLQRHIENDVYGAFHPKDYERRKENGGLIDFDDNLHVEVGDDFATLFYSPNGDSEQAKPDWVLHGDMMIRRIETAEPPYDWSGDVPGPRPFFKELTEQYIEGGEAEKHFVMSMSVTLPSLLPGATVSVTADGNTVRDESDWDG